MLLHVSAWYCCGHHGDFRHFKIDGSKAEHALLIELPEYKTPNAHTIAIYVWEKVKDYLSKAGTVIFIASIIMWL